MLNHDPWENHAPRGFFVYPSLPSREAPFFLEVQKMPRILVAIDGLSSSEKALEVAVKLAQQNGGRVTAVTVLDRSGDPHLDGLTDSVKAKVRRHLEEILQAAANFARSRGVLLTPVLCEGHPAEAVITCAEQQGTELLVVGSNNNVDTRPGLGGTADQISDHAPCTVMIVKCAAVSSHDVRRDDNRPRDRLRAGSGLGAGCRAGAPPAGERDGGACGATTL